MRHWVGWRREQQLADLEAVLEYPLTEHEEDAFAGMLAWLRDALPSAHLSEPQAARLAVVLERHRPSYRNLCSSGAVSSHSVVRSMVQGHPLKPPGR